MELRTLVIFLFCIGATIAAPAQTFTVLSDFNGPNGEGPFAPLVQASDRNFYGTATYGGNITTHIAISPRNCYVGCGTVFKMTPAGQMILLYQFCRTTGCPDGAYPIAGLVQASDGNLYGTTSTGGNANNGGTVFRITPQGTLTTLYDFCSQINCTDGKYPAAAMVEGSDGNLYGTTELGGTHGEKSNICAFNTPPKSGCGTVFRLTFAGELTTLYNFCAHKEVVAAGPVSRIRRTALQTDNSFEISRGELSMMSTLAVLAGFASHRRHNGRTETIVCW